MSDLYRRIETYGSRGIVEVESAEGQPVDPDAVRFLVPATSLSIRGGEPSCTQ